MALNEDIHAVDTRLDLYIEALIFASEYALSIDEIRKCVNTAFSLDLKKDDISQQIERIRMKYEDPDFAIQLKSIADGFLFMTKSAYHKIIEDFLRLNEKKRLSKAAMETLSIVAYKQPVTKTELESIRGVNSDYTIQKLLEKELVEISGRRDGPGRPLLYITTSKFLNHFGLKDKNDLPKLRELEPMEDSIGHSPNEIVNDGKAIDQPGGTEQP